MITFAVHQVRAGQSGASEDFEQMLALLVRATSGHQASLIFANPGDWGIDVLVGDLNGRVTIWQAKYFARGVGRSQQGQITSSFASALRAAAEHGYLLDRWVLCIPVSMDGPATKWWQGWKGAQERANGVAIDLWDETRLRELLLRPEAADIYRHYYAPFLRQRATGLDEPDGSFPARVDRAAEELAVAVRDQWHREEKLRRIQDPVAIPVRWTSADPLLSDHMENIGATRSSQIDLDGFLHEAADFFMRVPSRRLVVVGQPGAGKSVFALRFTLGMLARRQPGSPVPVIFSLHTWNPLEQPLQEWMAARLASEYPALKNVDKLGRTIADDLVRRQRILPVLDGLDEVGPSLRGDAMRLLNMSLDNAAPVVVTCRLSDYQQVVADGDVLTSAAVVELLPLRLEDLADYLPRTARKVPSAVPDVHTTKWEPVLRRMRADPEDPACRMLLEVLSAPLMASLARSVYSDTSENPTALLDGSFAHRQEIEAHLLDGFVPAAFGGPVAETAARLRQRWAPRAQEADRWLAFLASHLSRLGTRDLEWWRLENAAPPATRWLGSGLVIFLTVSAGFAIYESAQPWTTTMTVATAAAVGLTLGLVAAEAKLPSPAKEGSKHRFRSTLRRLCCSAAAVTPVGFCLGFMPQPADLPVNGFNGVFALIAYSIIGAFGVGITLGIAGMGVQRAPMTTPLRLYRKFRTISRQLLNGMGRGLFNGILVGLAIWTAVGVSSSAVEALRGSWDAMSQGISFGGAIGVLIAIVGGLMGGLLSLLGFPADMSRAISPSSTLRTDRNAALFRSGIITSVALTIFAVVVASGLQHNLPGSSKVASGIVFAAMAFGLMAATFSAWFRFEVARLWLSSQGKIPWRFMIFLDCAHDRGVLRQAGPVYQFRHARLQEQLATHREMSGKYPEVPGGRMVTVRAKRAKPDTQLRREEESDG